MGLSSQEQTDKFVLMRILIFVVSKCHTWHVLISDKLHSDFRWKPVTQRRHMILHIIKYAQINTFTGTSDKRFF